eukprot:TRINITY_DN3130_c0_g4_i1.p1 TRINITY_DN3130_c0_g4~~TRINITY_DN3130_c0_g4_i1.p1  ORF type:complete len:340 (-),score=96.62 TRINITY_DN3130_c0_g4_i1:46-1065(-)
MSQTLSLKKKLALLLLHCEKAAAKTYGVRLEIQQTKSIIKARHKFDCRRKAGQANVSQQLYKGMTLKPELGGYYGYKGVKGLKDKAASIDIKRMKKITEIMSSYTIKDVARIYQPLKSLQWKYATNRSHKIRSLSNSNKRKLNESLTPSFQNVNPSQYSLNSDISTDKFSEKNSNAEVARTTPKMLRTIEHDNLQSVYLAPQQESRAPNNKAVEVDERSTSRKKVNQIRLQHSKDKERSKSYNVLERDSLKTDPSNTQRLREGLGRIYKAFCKFKERNEVILAGKGAKRREVDKLKVELEEYARRTEKLEHELTAAKEKLHKYEAVSYTHLTLPTICSV